MAGAVSKVSGHINSPEFDRMQPSPPPPLDSSLLLATRAPRHAVSYWTCSKLCAICFVAGMVFGYSLRGRVKRWASNILKKLN
ncbi:hypothetical protein PHAVU_004G046500 [Phaseolus vulgaris]|uniref:Transmembrane protein n=1 Tax=Phaseolus vulgaris TaxID=3885 RepID=V7BZV6_PHAVU|nr:hypothetical protein PHAVU_004G046500g [Phaseolus vulgaris]ESW23434.1 hypothetical protein PHAVU_004G046500g [Phaseolus vulgaris]